MKTKRDAYVKRLNAAYLAGMQKGHVEYIKGHAKFTGPNEIVVGGEKIPAKRILIATGTKPMIPGNTPGEAKLCMVSSHSHSGACSVHDRYA